MQKKGLLLLTISMFIVSTLFVWLTGLLKTNSKYIAIPPKKEVVYSIALLADSHLDYQLLQKALVEVEKLNVDKVLHLGDLSDYGGLSNLKKSRTLLDNSGLDYLVIPGDRDIIKNGLEVKLEDSPFMEVFSDKLCTSQLVADYKIICFSNPYNYLKVSDFDLADFSTNISNSDVVISSQPIFNSISDQYMGIYDGGVLEQGLFVKSLLENSNVKMAISADTHFQNHYESNNINYYTIGAITEQRNIQRPSFSLLYYYTDNSYSVTQFEIE